MRTAITGLGVVSGFGAGVARLWSALLANQRALRPGLESERVRGCPPLALCADFPAGGARAAELALAAANEAVVDAALDTGGDLRLGIVLGTTLGGIDSWLQVVRGGDAAAAYGWTQNGPAAAVAEALRARGPVVAPSAACASSNIALGLARDLLIEGRCEVVLAGGVDALNDFVIAGFQTLKALDPRPCRPFDVSRRGLNLGEGAGLLVLESERHAQERGAPIRAFFDGYGSAADATHMTGPDRHGGGAARAMAMALADARVDGSAVGFVSAHGTATDFNDLMEAQALHRLLGATAAVVPVHSIKGAVGHTLGAAGALEAIVCVRALESGLVPATVGLEELDPRIELNLLRGRPHQLDPTRVLSSSSGFGGLNAAIVFSKK